MPTKKAAEKKAAPVHTLDDEREVINIMYYGDGGSWKTTHMAMGAHLGKIVFVNAEKGLKKTPLRRLGVPLENIEVHNDISWKGLEDLFWRLKGALEDDPDAYYGVAWDSATAIVKRLVRIEVEKAVSKAEKQGKDRDLFFTDRADYGVVTEQVRDLIRKFCDLPCAFMVSALERRDVDDDGRVKYGPSVTPGLQSDFYGWVDIVCHTEVIEIEGFGDDDTIGVGHFRPIGKYKAKDRLKITPRTMVIPSIDRLQALLDGTLDLDEDEVTLQAREAQRKAREAEKERRKNRKRVTRDEDDEEDEE